MLRHGQVFEQAGVNFSHVHGDARALPAVLGKAGSAICLLQLLANFILQVKQELFDLGDIRYVHKSILCKKRHELYVICLILCVWGGDSG
ncbi:hypothetical protein [Erwinia amylovora]|uniref:hypothetical protein n=1 Tax=Erwinia amylovora TaxID=552 RepID=UPI003D04A708